VTKETWDSIVRFYPGSGPEITMVFTALPKNSDVDTTSWQVLQHAPPVDLDGRKKRHAKKRFQALRRMSLMPSKKQPAEGTKTGQVAPQLRDYAHN
jgi:hypothetical protein